MKELEFPCDEKISKFFNELLNKFQDTLATKKQKFETEIIKSFELNNGHGQKAILKFTPRTLKISMGNEIFIYDLSEDINIELINENDATFTFIIESFFFSLKENEKPVVNQIIGLFKILRVNSNKSKAEIQKIIESKDDAKSSLIIAFINEFDKNKDSVLDVLESKTFADILKSNQKLIIEKNPDYIHKFVKLSN